MLPRQPFQRHGLLRRRCLPGVRRPGGQCRQNGSGIGRFGQVLGGAQLDGIHGGGDAGIAGQDHHGYGRQGLPDRPDQPQAAVSGQVEVQQHAVDAGWRCSQQGQGFGFVVRAQAVPAAPLERAGQHGQEHRVVINQQQGRHGGAMAGKGGSGSGRLAAGLPAGHRASQGWHVPETCPDPVRWVCWKVADSADAAQG